MEASLVRVKPVWTCYFPDWGQKTQSEGVKVSAVSTVHVPSAATMVDRRAVSVLGSPRPPQE